jgi:hypothetical protein
MHGTYGGRLAIASALLALSAASSQAATIVSCPFDPAAGGDQVTRGFYVTGYGGGTLDTVTLRYTTSVAESKTISLTARTGAYDGPIVGSVTATGMMSATESTLVFNFGNAPVAPGSTITFTQVLTAGTAPVFYNVGVGPCPGVTETDGTTPPLDTFRRNSIGVVITGASGAAAAASIPALNPLGLSILAALLAAAAIVTRRRHR